MHFSIPKRGKGGPHHLLLIHKGGKKGETSKETSIRKKKRKGRPWGKKKDLDNYTPPSLSKKKGMKFTFSPSLFVHAGRGKKKKGKKTWKGKVLDVIHVVERGGGENLDDCFRPLIGRKRGKKGRERSGVVRGGRGAFLSSLRKKKRRKGGEANDDSNVVVCKGEKRKEKESWRSPLPHPILILPGGEKGGEGKRRCRYRM